MCSLCFSPKVLVLLKWKILQYFVITRPMILNFLFESHWICFTVNGVKFWHAFVYIVYMYASKSKVEIPFIMKIIQ